MCYSLMLDCPSCGNTYDYSDPEKGFRQKELLHRSWLLRSTRCAFDSGHTLSLNLAMYDFDGAIMPEGMEDCSHLPQITEALVRKGYHDEDIRKILGGNLRRVMEQTQKVSHEMQAQNYT
jgi:hypothetical protein